MNDHDVSERRREAAGWLAIAREDVRVAQACLLLAPPALGVAAYHCQQAAEKLVKRTTGGRLRRVPKDA
jgi:hypothetical protein